MGFTQTAAGNRRLRNVPSVQGRDGGLRRPRPERAQSRNVGRGFTAGDIAARRPLPTTVTTAEVYTFWT